MPVQTATTLAPELVQHHSLYMDMALNLAEKGRYSCDPNPMVGAIIVKNGEIIGQGYHAIAGQEHAEVNAIADALTGSQDLTGCDLYVTLEPCSHTGKTPPCCDAIEAHRFAKIIIACQDPNPLVGGQGITRLGERYALIVGIQQNRALELNHHFFYRMRTSLPWVQIKMGASLDGKIALQNGQSQWITSIAARQDVHKLRLAASAVVTGRTTFITDNARLNAREAMLGFSPKRQPLRVILDRNFQSKETLSAQIPFQPTLVVHDENTVIKAFDTDESMLSFLKAPCKNNMIELSHLLTLLEKRSINNLLVEAGPKLAGQFLAQGLANEIVVYLAPLFLGPQAQSIFNLPLLEQLPNTRQWYFKSVELLGDPPNQDLKIVLRKNDENAIKF